MAAIASTQGNLKMTAIAGAQVTATTSAQGNFEVTATAGAPRLLDWASGWPWWLSPGIAAWDADGSHLSVSHYYKRQEEYPTLI